MALSREEIDHIATLARLDLTDAQREQARTELSQILESFEKLKELNTEDVPPMRGVLPLYNVLREDVAESTFTAEQALANAPEQAANMFVVPRVVEAE